MSNNLRALGRRELEIDLEKLIFTVLGNRLSTGKLGIMGK